MGVRYHDLVATNYTDAQLEGDRFAGIDERTWYFIEPSVTLRAGYKWIKAQLQIGKSYKLTSHELPYDSGMVTLVHPGKPAASLCPPRGYPGMYSDRRTRRIPHWPHPCSSKCRSIPLRR